MLFLLVFVFFIEKVVEILRYSWVENNEQTHLCTFKPLKLDNLHS